MKYFNIDGQRTAGTPTTREEFIKLFKELETLLYSDDRKYWVLYDEKAPETAEYEEIFWCIPTEEINFVYNENGWHIVSGVTLDEDAELISMEEDFLEEYENRLELFDEFEHNLTNYLLYDKRSNEETFKLWKAFEQSIAKATNSDVMADNKVCLILWLQNEWNAFFECVLNRTFKYMNVANIVLQSWNEFCA